MSDELEHGSRIFTPFNAARAVLDDIYPDVPYWHPEHGVDEQSQRRFLSLSVGVTLIEQLEDDIWQQSKILRKSNS